MDLMEFSQSALVANLATALVFLTTYTILVSENWRQSVAAFALQYLGIFFLAASAWPIELAVIKLVAGWMAAAVLLSAGLASGEDLEVGSSLSGLGRYFRLIAGGMVVLFIISSAPRLMDWLPFLSAPVAYGGGFLMGMGLLKLGFSSDARWVVLSLLMALSGFELFYAMIEQSAVVAGLLAAVHLGLALTAAYLFVVTTPEEAS